MLIYRASRSSTDTLNVLTDYLTGTIPNNPNTNFAIVGDFNLPFLVRTLSSILAHLLTVIALHVLCWFHTTIWSYEQINVPTRSNNISDLIFTPIDSKFISNVQVNMPTGQLDHSSIVFDLSCSACNNKLLSFIPAWIYFQNVILI